MSRFFWGVLAALGAGLLWGGVFVVPLLLPDYPPAYLTCARYAAFGLATLPIAWWQKNQLQKLTRQDWWTATRLSLIGNFAYYAALSSSIQLAGAPLPTLLIGTLPIVIALSSQWQNRHQSTIRWRSLAPSLIIIAIGLLCVNAHQIKQLNASHSEQPLTNYVLGGSLACVALAAWTWYPLRNSEWLARHPSVSGATWASAQGLVTLPMAIIGLLLTTTWYASTGGGIHGDFSSSGAAKANVLSFLGSTPLLFLGLMLFMGLGASWLGTLLWNIASKRTPPSLTGQLIVFETLAALCYAYTVYARLPSPIELIGITCLVLGVVLGVRQLRYAHH